MACSPPRATLPQVGRAGIPEINLPDRPAPPVFTEDEFKAMPITVKGKILKSHTSWVAWADIADAAVKGYRDYLKELFDKDKK